MKKIVGTIAAAALVAASAFAEVGIGSWGRAIWTPVAGEHNEKDGSVDVKSWEGVSWGANTARVGISIHGESENVGFNIDMNADGNAAGIGDTAYFWAKPWDFLEVKIGKVQDDTGRGNVAYGLFNWKRTGFGWTGEDVTFTRFGNGAGGQANGAIIKVTPIEGLWAIACFDVQDNKKAEETFGNHAQYGIGYDIKNVGSIRAQYIGGKNTTDWEGATVPEDQLNAAFDLTAVDGLRVTVGAYVPLHLNRGSNWTEAKAGAWSINQDTGAVEQGEGTAAKRTTGFATVKLAAGADFSISSVTLHALFVANLPNTYDKNNQKVVQNFSCGVGVGADVDFGNGIGLNADIRYQTATSLTEGTVVPYTYVVNGDDLSFLIGLTKSLSNGMIGIGFQGDIVSHYKGSTGSTDVSDFVDFNWSVPVVISAWF